MEKYVILTDSSCDLPQSYLLERNLVTADLTFRFEGEEGEYTVADMPTKEFYEKMRAGAVARTSALNAEVLYTFFAKYLAEGTDVLYIAFSSGLSGTYNAGRLAAERARADFPERRISVIDSLCASGGEGLLVAMAADKRDAGATFEEVEAYTREILPKMAHWFTVDDLVYLKRGGRVSPAAAFFGNMLASSPCFTWMTRDTSSPWRRCAAAALRCLPWQISWWRPARRATPPFSSPTRTARRTRSF